MATGEQRDEERLVGNRDPGRAVEDDAQQRRPRPAHAEEDQRRRRHSGGAVTTTSERAARSPTETKSEYVPRLLRCPQHEHLPRPDASLSREQPAIRTRIGTNAHGEAPAGRDLDAVAGQLDVADAYRHGASPRRSVPRPVDRAQPDLVRSRRHLRSVDPAEPDEPPLQRGELRDDASATVDEHHRPRALVDPVGRRDPIAPPVAVG